MKPFPWAARSRRTRIFFLKSLAQVQIKIDPGTANAVFVFVIIQLDKIRVCTCGIELIQRNGAQRIGNDVSKRRTRRQHLDRIQPKIHVEIFLIPS